MRVLFVHQNFPGQYGRIAGWYASHGHQVVAIGEKPNLLRRQQIRGIKLLGYELQAQAANADSLQKAVHRGKRIATAASVLRRSGFVPDVIFAHIGWGEAIFLKDIFPAAKMLLYGEFFYRSKGADLGFDAEYPATPEKILRLRVMNAPLLMSLDAADWTMTPTSWQWRQFPAAYRQRMSVVHDGIDTDTVTPGKPEDELITYVARNLEPYRGFHVFMRAIPEIQKRRPKARIVVVGGDEVSYSPRLPAGESYRRRLMKEMGDRVEWSRVHFLGRIPYPEYLSVLRQSSVHVYLTYPFVLSWSLLEAMSAGCLVVASRTPPVEEVIRDGENGLLTDFFSTEAIAARVDEALTNRYEDVRGRARRTIVENYDLRKICLPAQLALVEALKGQRADAGAAADVQDLPGDEARVPVGEEHHGARDVVGLA